jgi:hypothetical protein
MVNESQSIGIIPDNQTMSDDSNRWIPPDNVTNHGEGQLYDDDDFFAPPPKEIGEVTTAYTNLRVDKQPWQMTMRLSLGFFIGSFLAVAAFFCMANMTNMEPSSLPFLIFVPALAILVVVLITLAATGFSYKCSYVGREGLAEMSCSGSRDNVSASVFMFSEAAELRTTQVRRYVNGVYQGTTYTFNWTGRRGGHRYTITGTHNSESGKPAKKDNYHFASAAELAWSYYLLGFVQEQLNKDGYLHFSLGGGDFVRVGPDYLELSVSGQRTECATRDIGALSLQAGMFTIKRRDAKEGWFSSKGVFKFNYNSLANAQLFLFVLDKLTGLRPY